MARFVLGGVLLVACGKVSDTPAVPIADAPVDVFSCSASEMLCRTGCIDPTTDMMNCGACGATCQTGIETCQAGECTAMVSTCKDILTLNPTASDGSFLLNDGSTINCDFSGSTCAQIHTAQPSAGDGPYTKMDGSQIYCDMQDGGVALYGVAYGQYNVAAAGYAVISLGDFQSVGLQQSFIALYNAKGGMTLTAAFQASNCCFKYDASTNEIGFGSAGYIEPISTAGVTECGVASPPALAAFSLVLAPQEPPLPATFFATNPPQAITTCSTGNNPAFFWKETP